MGKVNIDAEELRVILQEAIDLRNRVAFLEGLVEDTTAALSERYDQYRRTLDRQRRARYDTPEGVRA